MVAAAYVGVFIGVQFIVLFITIARSHLFRQVTIPQICPGTRIRQQCSWEAATRLLHDKVLVGSHRAELLHQGMGFVRKLTKWRLKHIIGTVVFS